MSEKTRERALLVAIILGYLIVGGLFAIRTPDWQAPDEPAHYNYVAQVAGEGCCPTIDTGDWDSPYLEQLKSSRFDPALLDDFDAIQYEDHQPPLYYLLASIVYKLTNGSLVGLRLFSLLIGLAIIVSAYGIGKILLPDRPYIALSMAALVAFLPQHVAILASVNNDALAWALAGITLWATLIYLKTPSAEATLWTPNPLILGLLVGIGFVTKASDYLLAGVVPLAIFWKWYAHRADDESSLQKLMVRLALFFIPALLIGALWWLRNFGVYGFPDFLGLAAHDQVVTDQLRTAERIADVGFGGYLQAAWTTTFNSFWGQFGWMGVPMPGWIYTVLGLLMLLVISGLLIGVVVLRRAENAAGKNPRAAWVIVWLTGLLAIVQYFYYNSEFYQVQGRYLFTGLIPFALLVALGLDGWRRWLFSRFTWTRWILPLAFVAFAALDVYLLWRFIVPSLAP